MAGSRSKQDLTALQLLQQPEKLPERPVYAIFGDDSFLAREAWLAVRDRVLADGDPGLQVTEFDGETVELRDVLDELAQLAFGGGRRVVLVNHADAFISAHRSALERHLGPPRFKGVLVLRCRSWNRATRLAQLVAKFGCSIDARTPSIQSLTAWLPRWASQRYEKRLQPAAAALLLELVGPDPGSLHQELEKLAVFVGQRQEITVEDVDRIVVAGRSRTVWELGRAIAAGDAKTALRILDRLLLAGEAPVAISYALAAQFRRLARAARLILRGIPTQQALRRAGTPPFAIREATDQLRHLGRRRLLRLYDILLRADLQLKRSDADPRLVLESLILALAVEPHEAEAWVPEL